MEQEKPAIARDDKGRFLPGQSASPDHCWRAGQSGNPSGTSKLRKQFEAEMYSALVDAEMSEIALDALRKAVKIGEPWAVQLWFSKVLPPQLRIEAAQTDDFDLGRLSDAQLDELEYIIAAAKSADAVEGREVPSLPSHVLSNRVARD
jgi:hypothetical protein